MIFYGWTMFLCLHFPPLTHNMPGGAGGVPAPDPGVPTNPDQRGGGPLSPPPRATPVEAVKAPRSEILCCALKFKSTEIMLVTCSQG